MNVIAASLFARFASRQDDSPAMKAVAALRNQFGGHAVQKRLSVYVRRLELVDFRSYERVEVDLRAGRRACWSARTGSARPTWSRRSGYVATLGSHRVATDAPLVRVGRRARRDPLR